MVERLSTDSTAAAPAVRSPSLWSRESDGQGVFHCGLPGQGERSSFSIPLCLSDVVFFFMAFYYSYLHSTLPFALYAFIITVMNPSFKITVPLIASRSSEPEN